MLGATSSPPAPCSTPRPKGDGGRQDSECKIAKRRPKTVTGISSRWGGSTHREPKPTARRDLCASGQDKLKVLVLQELPWRTGRPPKLSGKRCCWPLPQWWGCSGTPTSTTASPQCCSGASAIPFPLITRVYKAFPPVATLCHAVELLAFSSAP